jgi:DNA-binding PadR family transcriptional regulator
MPLSIRQSLLAILAEGPVHGYGLKLEFDAATADVWPLNPGQVYTTLGRLERDGLVVFELDDEGQKVYELTDAGRDELLRWFDTPVLGKRCPARNWPSSWCLRFGPVRPHSVRWCNGSGLQRCGPSRTSPAFARAPRIAATWLGS